MVTAQLAHIHTHRYVLVLILLCSSDQSVGVSSPVSSPPLTYTHTVMEYNPVSNCDGI